MMIVFHLLLLSIVDVSNKKKDLTCFLVLKAYLLLEIRE